MLSRSRVRSGNDSHGNQFSCMMAAILTPHRKISIEFVPAYKFVPIGTNCPAVSINTWIHTFIEDDQARRFRGSSKKPPSDLFEMKAAERGHHTETAESWIGLLESKTARAQVLL